MFLIHGVVGGITKSIRNALSFDVRFQTNKLFSIPHHMLMTDSRLVSVLDFSKFKPAPVRLTDWVALSSTRVVVPSKQFSLQRLIAERQANECMRTLISLEWIRITSYASLLVIFRGATRLGYDAVFSELFFHIAKKKEDMLQLLYLYFLVHTGR